MLRVKNCCKIQVAGILPYQSEYFLHAKTMELLFFLVLHLLINREYVYSVVVYQKYLTRLRELIIFEPWRENYHFSQPS